MSTVVYLHRLKSRLPAVAKGIQCTCHRIFLAALILSAKYLNDSSPKNKHWARHTLGLFSLPEINLMEKQFLFLLDWDLRIASEDLYAHVLPYFIRQQVRLRPTQYQGSALGRITRSSSPYQQRNSQIVYPSSPPISFALSSASSSSSSPSILSSPSSLEQYPSYERSEAIPGKNVKSPLVLVVSRIIMHSKRDSNSSNIFSRFWRKYSKPSPVYSQISHLLEAWWIASSSFEWSHQAMMVKSKYSIVKNCSTTNYWGSR